MKSILLAVVAGISLAGAAVAQTAIPDDGSVRKLCIGDQCVDVPYAEAVQHKSVLLPHAVERAFAEGYISIEVAVKTTSGIVERANCGGFIIDAQERLVVTAQHCLPSYVEQLNGKSMAVEGISVRYLTSLPEADMALVQLDRLPQGKKALAFKEPVVQEFVFGRSMQLSPLADIVASKTVADQSFFLGPVSFIGTLVSKGQINVSRYVSAGDGRAASLDLIRTELETLRVQGQAEPGFSGSPLYNQWGQVIGIVSGGNASVNLVIAASAKDFPKLLQKYKDMKKRT